MAKKMCLDGQTWDNLLSVCIGESRPEPAPPTEPPIVLSPVRDTAPGGQADPLGQRSPALLAIVALVTLGSILALAVWLIICRRQTRLSSTSEGAAVDDSSDNVTVEAEPAHEPLQKPAATILPPPLERNGHADVFPLAGEAPSPCPHLYLGARVGSRWEEGFSACRGLTGPTDGSAGLPACSTVSEHRIPLPATELGGTALVTTKTV